MSRNDWKVWFPVGILERGLGNYVVEAKYEYMGPTVNKFVPTGEYREVRL